MKMVLVLALLPVVARADPTLGCFIRTYDAAHLAAHPDQVVAAMRLRLRDDAGAGGVVGDLETTTANQGHAARDGLGGQVFEQFLLCFVDQGEMTCGVECDGGVFVVTRDDGAGIAFRTDYLIVGASGGEGCGGAIDLAERPGEEVSYRLMRAPDAACEGIGDDM